MNTIKLINGFKENQMSFDTIDKRLHTSKYSILVWYHNVLIVDNAYNKNFSKIYLNQINENTIYDSDDSKNGGDSSIKNPFNTQLYVQLEQLCISTREVTKSLWCIDTTFKQNKMINLFNANSDGNSNESSLDN